MEKGILDWDWKVTSSDRRELFYRSLPKNKSHRDKCLIAMNYLNRRAMVSKQRSEKEKAKKDSQYYFNKLSEVRNIGR